MPSIFSQKAPKQPDYKQDLIKTETSILKRLNSFIDETTNKWKSTNDWITKTGDQVNELLKRTFDVQRKVEGEMIDLENKSKQRLLNYDAKIERFENHIEEKFATNDRFEEISSKIYDAHKKLDKKVEKARVFATEVRKEIPKDTVKKTLMEEVVAELRERDEKIAGSIPKNVASNDLVADTRREIIAMFDSYPTTDALKSVQSGVEARIKKVADVSAVTTRENKKTRKEFEKVAAKVTSLEQDYVSQKMLPSIEEKIKESTTTAAEAIKAVQKEIPTDYAKTTEVEVLREFQKDIMNQFESHKKEQNQSIANTMSNIESIMSRSTNKVEKEIESFKSELAETTMGEDTNFMKNIIRDIADEEIKSLRNQSMLFQENVKNNMIEMKNQNRAMAQKMTELQSSFDKLIKLAQNK